MKRIRQNYFYYHKTTGKCVRTGRIFSRQAKSAMVISIVSGESKSLTLKEFNDDYCPLGRVK